jgi:hypothetical protein
MAIIAENLVNRRLIKFIRLPPSLIDVREWHDQAVEDGLRASS